MTTPTGDVRKLQYPLTYSEGAVSEIPDNPPISTETLNWITEDSDEYVPIVLNVSLNEYVALSSAIDIGRDIGYGSNAIYIWWIWVRSVMNFCEAVIDCIETDIDTQNAINNLVLQQTYESLRENAQTQNAMILGDGNNPTCDLDALFGGIVAVIDRANTNNIDVLQQFEVFTNIPEIVSKVMPSGASGAGILMAAVIDWCTWIQDNILENYEAEVTTAYLEEIYCGLFCLVKEDCILTPEVLTNYFYDRLSSALTIESVFNDTVGFLVSGSWSGTEIADVMFLSQFAIRAQIGSFLGFFGFSDIDRDMRIGFLQPSSLWTILCTECNVDVWEHVFDFTVDDGDFVPQVGGNTANTFGAWTAAGWGTEDKQWNSAPNQFRRGMVLLRNFTETFISEIDYQWDFTEGNDSGTVTMLVFRARLSTTTVGSELVKTSANVASGLGQMTTLTINGNADNLVVVLTPSSWGSAVYTGSAKLLSMTVRGEGVNPFV